MNIVKAHSVFSAMVVGASLTVRSAAIALGNEMVEGFFDLQITATTGTGTARIQYELSNDGTNYVTPTGAADIVTAHTVTSGPGSDGKDIYSFTPEVAQFMRLLITETGGVNPITITGILAVQ